RWLGLLVAAIAFLLGNLFLQVPMSVLGVLLTSPQRLEQLPPMEPAQVPQKTTLPGLKVRQILPPMTQ
ncbi:MAG: low-complexity tail membrane protein, partial [Spirulinaceae cyanobacterium]